MLLPSFANKEESSHPQLSKVRLRSVLPALRCDIWVLTCSNWQCETSSCMSTSGSLSGIKLGINPFRFRFRPFDFALGLLHSIILPRPAVQSSLPAHLSLRSTLLSARPIHASPPSRPLCTAIFLAKRTGLLASQPTASQNNSSCQLRHPNKS